MIKNLRRVSLHTPGAAKGLLFSSLVLLLFFIVQKPLFMVVYYGKYFAEVPATDWLRVIAHGLTLDLTMVGYLALLPTLLLLAGCVVRIPQRLYVRVLGAYYAVVCFVLTAILVADMFMYNFWGFRLDTTPLIYITTSFEKTLASVALWIPIVGVLGIGALAWALWRFVFGVAPTQAPQRRSAVGAVACVLLLGVEFLMIRGSVTTSVQNTGRVYFSSNVRLNHAAVNPAFNLIESFAHDSNFATKYRYMTDAEAEAIVAPLLDKDAVSPALTDTLFTTTRPNVVVVMLESFSTMIMESFGGLKGVTPQLDSIARQSILFTNLYANSFRTDRGLVATLSGYPAQPTASVMKYPRKTQNLPSIARSLTAQGYHATYYFGGDADFTNRRSYLVSATYDPIIADKQFPVKLRMQKWGVPDGYVFDRLLDDIRKGKFSRGRQYATLQTSSSHEPFDVPFHRLQDERLNAFAYTDDCLGRFLREFRRLPEWQNTVVVLVADHVGSWPVELDNFQPWRYHIPMVITGGAIRGPRRIDTIGSQHDLAATLLAQMQLPHQEFVFSKNLLNPHNEHFAFFTVPDAFGVKTAEGCIIFDNKGQNAVYTEGHDLDRLEQMGKAYLQKLYDNLAVL